MKLDIREISRRCQKFTSENLAPDMRERERETCVYRQKLLTLWHLTKLQSVQTKFPLFHEITFLTAILAHP